MCQIGLSIACRNSFSRCDFPRRPIAFDTRLARKERHSATPGATIRSRANISSMTRIGFEIDHQVRRLGFVGLKARLGRIGPTGEVHHNAPPAVILLRLDGFHDVEALAVEEEGVTTE